MKVIKLISIAVIGIILFLLISCDDESPNLDYESYTFDGWQLQKHHISQSPFDYNNYIHFINENTGFAIVGEQIFRTSDAGTDWIKLDSVTNFLANDIQFLNEDIGFIAADSVNGAYPTWGIVGGMLLKTHDGGSSWSIINYPTFTFGSVFDTPQQIQFFDKNNGVAIMLHYANNNTSKFLAKTKDGGETWEPIDLKINIEFYTLYEDIYEKDGVVFIVGEDSVLYKSNDQGKSWEKLHTPFQWIKSIDFLSHQIGYIADSTNIAKTIDGGNSWTELEKSFSAIEGFNFINDNEGVIIDFYSGFNQYSNSRGVLIHSTSDGGLNWKSSDFIEDINFHLANYPDDNIGYSLFYSEFYKLIRVE